MNDPRTVLVTGASTGIGRAVCLDLAQRGWRVFGSVRREQDGADLEQATPTGATPLTPLLFDVTDVPAITAAADSLRSSLNGSRLQALVNNAGVAIASPLATIPLEAFRRQMAINVEGVLACTQAFLPLMRGGPSRLVNISSIAGKVGFPTMGPYHASKHALEGLSDCLRMELKHLEVEVVLVEPGPVKTAIWETARGQASALEEGLSEQGRQDYGHLITQVSKAVHQAEKNGVPVEECALAVRRAIESPRPRTRYVVGRSGKTLLFLRRWLLSDRLLDRMIMKSLKL